MAKAEKVAKAGITREAGWLYYLDKTGNVSRSRMARGAGGVKNAKGEAQVIAHTAVKRDNGFIYFIDVEGDVSRTPRNKGGVAKKAEEPKAAPSPLEKKARASKKAPKA